MLEYYSRRVSEYEAIYRRDDPVRQAEQVEIADEMKRLLAGRRVLEVACGTGYWTQAFAETAESVVATDGSAEMLEAARAKGMDPAEVAFVQADAYRLDGIAGRFDAGANFWLSHVPKTRVAEFLSEFHRKLDGGAIVFVADSVFVPNLGGELVADAGDDDTYKLRTLSDGSQHKIVKNYYDADEIRGVFKPFADDLHVHVGACFWWVWYETRKG